MNRNRIATRKRNRVGVVRESTGITIFFVLCLCGAAVILFGRRLNEPPAEEGREVAAARKAPSPSTPEVVLAEEKQRAIWDAEHATFEIETRLGKPFVIALQDGDAARIAAMFQDGCVAETLDEAPEQSVEHGPLTQRRKRADGATRAEADTDQLVARLLQPWTELSSVEQAGFRVLKIDKTAGGWKTEVLISGAGRRAGGQTDQQLRQFDSQHVVEFRYARDEQLGVEPTISRWSMQSWTTRWAARPLMEEITKAMQLDRAPLHDNWKVAPEQTQQAHFQLAVEDYDRDGFLDIAVATGFGDAYLLRSSKGRYFVDVARGVGLQSWENAPQRVTYLVAWIDYDNDGFPDLLMGDRLYHNERGARFRDVTSGSGLFFGPQPSGCVTADFDNDGLLDLYVLYQRHPGDGKSATTPKWVDDDQSGVENHLWRNVGDGRFVNVTKKANAGGGRRETFAAACLHLDDDTYVDLYLANDFGKNVMLRNRGDGTFEDVTASLGVSDFATSMGVAAGDLNNDGASELYVANMYSKMGRRIIAHVSEDDYPKGVYAGIRGACAGNRLYQWRAEENRFVERSEQLEVNAVGWSHAPAMADFDGDGWLDLYSTAGYLSFRRDKPDG